MEPINHIVFTDLASIRYHYINITPIVDIKAVCTLGNGFNSRVFTEVKFNIKLEK
jgi:hypothetical protein